MVPPCRGRSASVRRRGDAACDDPAMRSPRPAAAIVAAPRSGIRAIVALLEGRDDVINLTFGEPDFDTPVHVAAAGAAAIRAGRTRYAPGAGIAPLRAAIARSVGGRAGVDLAAASVVVTAGGVQAILGALSALVDPGRPTPASARCSA